MKEIDETPTGGAGYSEEGIEGTSGVAPTSSAVMGYDPFDGTYTAPKKKYEQKRFVPQPTNTGDPFRDRLNEIGNQVTAQLLMDPAMDSLVKMYDERYGGHGLSDYRDGMDDYMLHEFGRSDYDKGATNVLTSEDAKRNRAERQSNFMLVANGGARFVNRALGTAAAGVVGIVDALTTPIQKTAGVSLKDYGLDAEGIANITEANTEWLNKNVPLYQSQEDEQYMQENPFKGTFLTAQGWASFIDNLGFTAGAAITAALVARLGPAVSSGIGAAVATKTVQDYLDASSNGDVTAKDLLPLAVGVAGTVMAKTLPMSSALKTQVATLAASVTASFGEGEIEAVNAKNEFIGEKSAAIDVEVAKRKELVMREMESQLVQSKKDELAQLVKEGKMTEGDARMEALRLAREERETREWQDRVANQMAILDWEGTRVKNRITSEAESVAGLTRLLNVGVLSASNMIQFGKVFNGGYKTYRTMRHVEAAKDAREAADKAYKAALRNAKSSAERASVRARRGAIRVEAMRKWAVENGGQLFDESKGLTRGDWFDIIVKNPASEGLEEVAQGMISAGATGASEWDVDDYYSQISGVEAYRKAESAVMAGVKSAVGKLGETGTWAEFVSGALTGALGMPSMRMPFKKSDAAAPKDGKEAARRFRLRNLQSPIFLQGGAWGEFKKARSDREAMARMAKRLNEAMTDKQLETFRARMGHIARHMQYEDDKRMWADGDGDKFKFENAVDADLLNSIELFQNSGNMDMLRGMVQSMLDVKTTEDLLALQSLTETDDGKGGKTGPYSEFKITNLGKDATEEQRKASAEQEELMRKKIARDVNRQLRAIDAYAKTRLELDFETKQGLSDAQLNCLTWYRVRLSMFDDRSKEMFADIEKDLDTLDDGFKAVSDDIISAADKLISTVETSLKGKEDSELTLQNGRKITGREYLQALRDERSQAVASLNAARDAIREARGLSGASKKIRKIFEAQKVLDADASEKELADVNRIAAKQNGLTIIANNLEMAEVGGLFSDETRRKDFARKIRDILSAQNAITRYESLYKLYRKHPALMAQRAAEHDEEVRQEALAADKAEAKESLSACKTKAELYATIEKMIDDGKDTDVINAAIDELIKSGSALAKDFYESQKYVRYFANALTRVVDNRVGFSKDTDEKKRSLIPLILQQLMLDAAASVSGCKAMREYVMAQIDGELSTPEGLIAYLTRNGLLEKEDSMTVEELNEVMNIFLRDEKGKPVPDGKAPNGRTIHKSVAKTKFAMLHDALPVLFNAANNVLLRDAKRRMSLNLPNVDVSDFDLMTLRGAINRNYTPYDNKAYDKVEKTARIGRDATPDNGKGAGETKDAEKKQDGNDESVDDGAEKRKVDGKDVIKFGQEESPEGKDTPAEELNEENSNIGEGTVSETVSVDLTKGEVTNGSKDDDGAAERLKKQGGDKAETSDAEWRPAVSFFNLELRKKGNFVRNLLVSLFGGAHVAKKGEKRSFEKFFNMLEKLGAFRFTDDTQNAVTVGEPVYFVVDKMKDGKSEIFGLSESEIAYEGAPIVFMCVKRGDRYQCVGTMHTSKGSLEKNGQLDFYNAVVENAKKSKGAYVHKDANGDAITMPVKKVMPGFVQTSDSEHAILDVVGGKENADKAVFAIYTGNGVCFGGKGDVRQMKKDSLLEGEKDMAVGRLHILVKDNATGKHRPMPCRIARYGKDDEAMYKGKDSANAIDAIVGRMSELAKQYAALSANGKPVDKIIKSFNNEYKKLADILAMKGYGLHMDLVVKDGIPKIRFSQIVYKDGKAVVLKRTDKLKVNGIEWEDKNESPKIKGAELEYDKEDRYLRKFIYVDANPNAVVNTLKSFDLQFRVRLKNNFVDNDDLSALVGQGLITTNIEPGCGVHTYGTSVVVNASSIGKSEPAETKPKDTDSVSLHGDERYVTILGEQFCLRGKRIFDSDGREIKHYPTIRGIRHYIDTPEECRVIDLSTAANTSDCDVYCLWNTKSSKAGVRCRAYRSGDGRLEFDMLDTKNMAETQYIDLDMLRTSNDFINLMNVYDVNGQVATNSLKLREQGGFSEVCEFAGDILSHLARVDYDDNELIESMLAQMSNEQDKADMEIAIKKIKNWIYCLRKTDGEKASKLIAKIFSETYSHDEAAALGSALQKNVWPDLDFIVSEEMLAKQEAAEAVAVESESESAKPAEEAVTPNNETEDATATEEDRVEPTEEDAAENTAADASNDAAAGATEDAAAGATEDVAADAVEDVAENAVEEVANDAAGGTEEDAVADTTEDTTEDAAEDIPTDATEDVEDVAEDEVAGEEDVTEEDIADEDVERRKVDAEDVIMFGQEEVAEAPASGIDEDSAADAANEPAEVAQEDATKNATEEETAEEDASEEAGVPAANEKKADVTENGAKDATDAAKRRAIAYMAAKKAVMEDIKNTVKSDIGENYIQRFTFSVRRKGDEAKPKIDINKELEAIRKILPWLERENAIVVLEHLITVGKNGMKAQGLYTHGIVSLSHEACRGTGFHEAFHAVFRTSLTDEKRREIYDAMRRDYGYENPIEAEEFLADEFAKFMVDRVYGTTLVKRVKDFFTHLWCIIRGGYRSRVIMDDLFHKINDGGFATRDVDYEHHIVERRKWWLRVGHKDKDWILNREDYLTSFAARPPHIQSMLEEAGWTEDSFDRLTQEQREKAVRCL